MDDLQRMQIYGSFNNFAYNESTDIFRKPFSFSDVLIQIFAVDILSDDVDM